MLSVLSLALLAVLCVFISADTQSFIPLSKDGHAFHRGNTASLTTVEYFIDLSCSACMDSWELLGEVYATYKDKVHFLYRVFPLPYHQQGFILAKAAQVVSYYGSSPEAVFTFFDTCYAKQPAIYNSATADMTYNQVLQLVADWAVAGTGVSTAQYYAGMNSSTSVGSSCEMGARYMWKYCTLQHAFATPLFQVDGLQVGGLDTLADWQSVLDPLVA